MWRTLLVHPFPLPESLIRLFCSWHLSPDDPPAIKELVDDFDDITLLEGQLILLHGCVAFLDNVWLTCTQNRVSRLCATSLRVGLSLSSTEERKHQGISHTF